MIVYHATTSEFDVFEKQPKKDAGFHFGTFEQAKMRGGPNATILEVKIDFRKAKRLKDNGSWTRDQINRARQGGYDAIVYLNRYEGISTEVVEALSQQGKLSKLDNASDAVFRKLVPQAEDSYIVFSPEQITILNYFDIYGNSINLSDAPSNKF